MTDQDKNETITWLYLNTGWNINIVQTTKNDQISPILANEGLLLLSQLQLQPQSNIPFFQERFMEMPITDSLRLPDNI